jgi:gamma-glutamylcyclotransferase (GGCT)/AIG2-like uncharacterized protein YtfP
MHLFAYGTLQFDEVLQRVVGRTFERIGGVAQGYANRRVQGALYPGMIAATGEVTSGVVLLDVDAESLATLDDFEDTGFYTRQTVPVACADGQERLCEAYLVLAKNLAALTDEPWNAANFLASGDLQRFVSGYAGFTPHD